MEHVSFILILGLIIIFPALLLQFMRTRFLVILTATAFVFFCIDGFQSLRDYQDDRFGFGGFLNYAVLASALIGAVVRLIVLGFQDKMPKKLERKEALFLVGIVAVLLFNQMLGFSGVCIYDGRKLNDEELINRILERRQRDFFDSQDRIERLQAARKRFSGYYKVSKGKKSILGSHRFYLATMVKDGENSYKRIHFQVDACGKQAGDNSKMGYSENEYKKWVEQNAHYYIWIE